jgi:hypothetical protein
LVPSGTDVGLMSLGMRMVGRMGVFQSCAQRKMGVCCSYWGRVNILQGKITLEKFLNQISR